MFKCPWGDCLQRNKYVCWFNHYNSFKTAYLKTSFKICLKRTLYTCKQPLKMAYGKSESIEDNFGKFIHQFTPETKTLIRKLDRIFKKLYRQNVFLLFDQICLNERLLPNYTERQTDRQTDTHTHTHIYIYI